MPSVLNFLNSFCKLATLDHVPYFHIYGNTSWRSLPFSRQYKVFKKYDKKKDIRFKRILNRTHNFCECMYHPWYHTDIYRLHNLFHYIFCLILLYYSLHFCFEAFEYTFNLWEYTSYINFNVAFYSVFGTFIKTITIIFYPLFVRGGLCLLLFLPTSVPTWWWQK